MNFRNIGSSGPGQHASSHFLPFASSRSSSLFSDPPSRPQYQRPRLTRAKSSPPPRPKPLEIREPSTGIKPLAPKRGIPDVPKPVTSPSSPRPTEDTVTTPLLPSRDDPLATFAAFTPLLLEDTIEQRSRNLIMRDVTPSMLSTWESQYPEVRETSPLRYEYDSHASRFIVKCATSPVHESVSIFFTHQVSRALEARLTDDQYLDMVQVSSGACYRGFNGNGYTAHSKKLPDAYLHIDGFRFPTVVCETGWAESMADLQRDARLWLLGTQGETRVVVVVAFTELPSPPGPTHPDETALLASISPATELLPLADALVTLHVAHHLRKPLLGAVAATAHLFRATPTADAIVECFSCSLLPADGVADLPLALGDLLSPRIAAEYGIDPEEVVRLPLARLRTIVAKQMPKQVLARAMDRAVALLKGSGVWEGEETFAQGKRAKRKRGGEEGEGDGV